MAGIIPWFDAFGENGLKAKIASICKELCRMLQDVTVDSSLENSRTMQGLLSFIVPDADHSRGGLVCNVLQKPVNIVVDPEAGLRNE